MSAPRTRVAGVALLAATVLTVADPARALAHKPSDSYLTLDVARGFGRWDIAVRDLDDALALDGDGDGAVSWRDLRLREADVADYAIGRLALDTPAGACRLTTRPLGLVEHSDGVYVSLPLAIDCPAPTASVTVDYRLLFDIDPEHQGLVRAGGRADAPAAPLLFTARAHRRAVATGGPAAPALAAAFVAQGVRHIWGGLDHILFLLALLVPAVLRRRSVDADLARAERAWQPVAAIRPALRDVAQVVTSFTAAHSLTLSLAALDLARMPARITEPAIAASVVLAAVNNVRPLFGRDRWVVAFALGLLHGFGFSSVLTDTGLAGLALLPALAGFNLGVEVGQLAIVAAVVPLCFALRRTVWYRRFALSGGSLAIAAIGLVWFVERALDTPLFPLVLNAFART
ncbi:MAG TPA: HupE/UreJ family protein [Polyangia bacterium]|nr:HupE/UreJ family protein [Polyangia bacterium]